MIEDVKESLALCDSNFSFHTPLPWRKVVLWRSG